MEIYNINQINNEIRYLLNKATEQGLLLAEAKNIIAQKAVAAIAAKAEFMAAVMDELTEENSDPVSRRVYAIIDQADHDHDCGKIYFATMTAYIREELRNSFDHDDFYTIKNGSKNFTCHGAEDATVLIINNLIKDQFPQSVSGKEARLAELLEFDDADKALYLYNVNWPLYLEVFEVQYLNEDPLTLAAYITSYAGKIDFSKLPVFKRAAETEELLNDLKEAVGKDTEWAEEIIKKLLQL